MFPIGVLRYMKETGLTHEQLAMVAVVQRQWSSQNPRAMMRDLITVDDVLNSRMVAYPMHLLECCLVTDGGGALIVTSAERASSMDLSASARLPGRDGRVVGDPDGVADGGLHDVEGLPGIVEEGVRRGRHQPRPTSTT